MLITKPEIEAWLSHRFGSNPAKENLIKYKTKAFELNQQGIKFVDTFGKRRIKSFVGFIDLAGFSTHVQDKPPEAIAVYLKPFIEGVIDIVTSHYGMVDKTIGDEIMFVLPDPEEAGMFSANLLMGQMLGGLHDFAFSLGDNYQYRIGLSHGDVVIDRFDSDNYSEWTLFGETVHVAKRIMSLECVVRPSPIVGVFGLKVNDGPESAKKSVTKMLSIIAGFASRWMNKTSDTVVNLKGIGSVAYGYFQPRNKQ